MSETQLKELRKISERMKGQDNRITSHPIFVVQQRRRICGMDTQWGGDVTWLFDGEEIIDANDDQIQKVKEYYEEHGEEPEGWVRTGYVDIWEMVQHFFSQKAADEYIERNRHNMTDPRVYVGSARRNNEWQAVRSVLLDLQDNEV